MPVCQAVSPQHEKYCTHEDEHSRAMDNKHAFLLPSCSIDKKARSYEPLCCLQFTVEKCKEVHNTTPTC